MTVFLNSAFFDRDNAETYDGSLVNVKIYDNRTIYFEFPDGSLTNLKRTVNKDITKIVFMSDFNYGEIKVYDSTTIQWVKFECNCENLTHVMLNKLPNLTQVEYLWQGEYREDFKFSVLNCAGLGTKTIFLNTEKMYNIDIRDSYKRVVLLNTHVHACNETNAGEIRRNDSIKKLKWSIYSDSIKIQEGGFTNINQKLPFSCEVPPLKANSFFESQFRTRTEDGYLEFVAEESNASMYFNVVNGEYEYMLSGNPDQWRKYESNSVITLQDIGDAVYFRALDSNDTCLDEENWNNCSFYIDSGKIACKGNIQSLLDKWCKRTDAPNTCYCSMFKDCTSLTKAPALPATTLDDACYSGMFNGCSSLTTAPTLPATTLANSCYSNMFNYCTSLTKAPALPATTLARYCYSNMFRDCTSLATAPELPATTLAKECYNEMFSSCSSLTTAPTLPATTLAENCYYCMFSSTNSPFTISNKTFDEVANLVQNEYLFGYAWGPVEIYCSDKDMRATFDSNNGTWILEETDIITEDRKPLAFTANEDGSSVSLVCWDDQANDWNGDFRDSFVKLDYLMDGKTWQTYIDPDSSDETLRRGKVINLNKDETVYFRATLGNVKENPNLNGFSKDSGLARHYFVMEGSIKADGNIQFLLENTGTKMNVPDYCYCGMFQDCTSLTQAPELPATTLGSICYQNMFSGCSSLTQAPELPATTLADQCYYVMFDGCSSLTSAPELPATTLANSCYGSMFRDCTNINNINVNFSDWRDTSDTYNWVKNVSSSGTFTCPADLPEEFGNHKIPTGWTVVRK